MLDDSVNDLVAGVAGAGTMGRGIVQVLAQCGARTLLFDAQPGAAQRGKAAIGEALAKLAEKGRLKPAEVDATLGRIEVIDRLERFSPSQVLVEAIVEDLGAKRELFSRLESIVDEGCVLASNTSSLSVTEMAAACKRPERVAGYHFFNPVPVMKIVEVVDGVLTAPWATDALTALARRFGHEPIRCKDTPGFVVNHAGRAFVPESLRVLAEGIADFASIDRILVDAAGFRIGPFGLMDLVGLDVAHAVMKSMYRQYYDEPKYRPSFLAEPRVAAGLLGRKTRRGWYTYAADGSAEKIPEPAVPTGTPKSAWAVPELESLISSTGNKDSEICFVAPLGKDVSTAALELGLDPARTVGVDPLFGFSKRRTLMVSPATRRDVRAAAHAMLAFDGVPVSVINDSPGFVAQRVVAHIVNIGCDIAQMRIATPGDLDRAVMLGLGYPKGPLAMGDAIGASKILAVLENMHAIFQEPRYRPSPWLRRRAQLGLSLLTQE
jgi:3-hydroxybutyryl-CoA dehydrogenase